MKLEKVSEAIWTSTVRLRVAPGFYLPASMFVVEAAPGELLLYSPHRFDDDLEIEIRERGDVRWILAPNDFHHMFVADAAARFTDAAVYGTPRAIAKHRDLDFAGELSAGPPAELPESVAVLQVEGMRFDESLLWLPDDSSLVTTDLLLNVRNPEPWFTRAVLGLLLDYDDRPSQGKEYRWLFVNDRRRYAESMHDLLARPFDNLLMAHGEPVTEGGNEALRRAVAWALGAAGHVHRLE